MIYYSADDYGVSPMGDRHIEACIEDGVLNKVSVFANGGACDLKKLGEVVLSLHLNLVEGKALSAPAEIPLLVFPDGHFKHTFGGLVWLSLTKGKAFKKQVQKEIRAQITAWQKMLPPEKMFAVDSHQHTHMIPSVFSVLTDVLSEAGIQTGYLRFPCEPPVVYLAAPSLYKTYAPQNIIKQWLLLFFGLCNRSRAKAFKTASFMGILFSGKMDEERVRKILPKYIKRAEKKGCDIEVLFHPGYMDAGEPIFGGTKKNFGKFYYAKDRKTEFDTVINLKEKESVHHGVY